MRNLELTVENKKNNWEIDHIPPMPMSSKADRNTKGHTGIEGYYF